LALAQIGQTRITALDEVSAAAEACNTLYATTRDEVLAMRAWSFAKKRALLSRLDETPVFGYDYYFALPPDFIRLLGVNNHCPGEPNAIYEIEAGKIATNEETVYISYVRQEKNVTLFDALFCEAFSVFLASKLTAHITGDWQLANNLLTKFQGMAITQAGLVDAVQQRPAKQQPARNSSTISARRGWRQG